MTKTEAIDEIIKLYISYRPTTPPEQAVLQKSREVNIFYLTKIWEIIESLR